MTFSNAFFLKFLTNSILTSIYVHTGIYVFWVCDQASVCPWHRVLRQAVVLLYNENSLGSQPQRNDQCIGHMAWTHGARFHKSPVRPMCHLNSLTSGRCGRYFEFVIFRFLVLDDDDIWSMDVIFISDMDAM